MKPTPKSFLGFKINRVKHEEIIDTPAPNATHYELILELVEIGTKLIIEDYRINNLWIEQLQKTLETKKYPQAKPPAPFGKTDDPNAIYIWNGLYDGDLMIDATLEMLEDWGVNLLNKIVKETNKLYREEVRNINEQAIERLRERSKNIKFS